MMKARGIVDSRRATEGGSNGCSGLNKRSNRGNGQKRIFDYSYSINIIRLPTRNRENNEEGEERKNANADPNELTNFGQRRVEKDYVLLKP